MVTGTSSGLVIRMNRRTVKRSFGFIDLEAHERVMRGTGRGLLDQHLHAWARIGILLGIEHLILNQPMNIDRVTGEVWAWVQGEGRCDV